MQPTFSVLHPWSHKDLLLNAAFINISESMLGSKNIKMMAVFWVVAPCSLIALMMEAAMTSETLENFYQTTRRYNPKTAIFILTAVRTSNPTKNINLSRSRKENKRI
jgi:hypothetical protein